VTAFLDGSPEAQRALVEAATRAAEMVAREFRTRDAPSGEADPDAVARILEGWPLDGGADLATAITEVGEHVIRHAIDVAHPRTVAHLHCPPLIAAIAAEVVIAATNNSMDSWDQGPTATQLEQQTVDWLCRALGYGPGADGVFTSGGTQSNLMGLLLARDRAVARHGRSANADGIGPEAERFRILCAQGAHFSVLKSARQLGLGGRAVIPVAGDSDGRMTAAAAAETIERLHGEGCEVIALSATAGTTDLGTFDPLDELAALAREHDAWLHVDAAVGGVLVTSDRERHRLAGLAGADSITVDFHKLWFQPISCGAFVVRDRAELGAILYHADYLNPEPVDAVVPFPNLVDKSLATTRRFDALKLALSLRVHGSAFFGAAAEVVIDLAAEAGRLVEAAPGLELARRPTLNTVLFRHEGDDALNLRVRRELLLSGSAVLAQTRLDERIWLKLTLMNPQTTVDDVRALLDLVVSAARRPAPAAP
jgi:L-2,4-diaminobutyrate decarboxylase